MHLKLDNPKLFSDIIGIISELVTELKIKVTKEGLSATAIDPANVAMANFKIPTDLFSEFTVDRDHILGVNLENLKAVLRRCRPGSKLVLEREDNTLKIGIQDRIKRDFSLALLDIDAEDKELPQWEFSSVIRMDAESFSEVVEDCLVVGDACTFLAEPNRFIVEAQGLNSSRAEFSGDDIEIHSANSKARYSLEYLAKFSKGGKISSKATINFSNNHPLRLDFASGLVQLSFVLAPRRIEGEEA
jgi:proliferating cell nuclear antigen